MTRSKKKGDFYNYTFLRKILNNESDKSMNLNHFRNEAIKKNWFLNKTVYIVYHKNSIILDFMVGLYCLIYNGENFFLLFIKESMVGYRLGEFIFTKKIGKKIHEGKNKVIKNKKR